MDRDIPMVRHIRSLPAAVMLAVVLVLTFGTGSSRASAVCAPDPGGAHRVARVLDGDTVVLDDGREVRLIGALAPKPNLLLAMTDTWPPSIAAREALEALVADREVVLRYSDRREDRYGRLLAQLYLPTADGETWVQQHLVGEGHAWAYALPGDFQCLRALIQAEAEARVANRGLWSDSRFPIYDALEDTGRLIGMDGRFVLVRGTVQRVARTKETTYLNFGDNWRTDFTASIATRIIDRAGSMRQIENLAGRRIRVRGWIEKLNGPMIVLSTLDEIELIDTGAASEPLASEGRIIGGGGRFAPERELNRLGTERGEQ